MLQNIRKYNLHWSENKSLKTSIQLRIATSSWESLFLNCVQPGFRFTRFWTTSAKTRFVKRICKISFIYIIQEWEKKCPKFAAFKEQQENLEEAKGLKLNALLITPIQRVPRLV